MQYTTPEEATTMALLSLVRDNAGSLFLHSTAPSKNAGFSIFDLDGEGSGDPFGYSNNTWTEVQSVVEGIEYEEDDTDSFWQSRQVIIEACLAANIELPEYVEV